jgi:hypothetical protein
VVTTLSLWISARFDSVYTRQLVERSHSWSIAGNSKFPKSKGFLGSNPRRSTMIKVPNEWLKLAKELLANLNWLKKDKDYETLQVLWIVEKDGHLKVAYRLEPDVDELYEVIMNIIKDYEKRMQAISFNKTSNIQDRTGGNSTAF